MAVKTYQKGNSEKLSDNFKTGEFHCQGVGCCTETAIDEKLVEYLQKIRDHFGKPVLINSGYRCKKHNAEIPNAGTKSKHMDGKAADIMIRGVQPAEIAQFAESIGVKGIGLYDTAADGLFVHIDTRDTKYFWRGHRQEYAATFGGAPEKTEKKEEGYEMNMRIMRRGDEGEDVRALQILLKGRDYDCGAADGIYGPNTESKVRAYQADKKLTVDGIAGPATMGSLLGAE